MTVKIEEERVNDQQNLVFPYLDRNEAIFALNAIKHIDCAYCPDFLLGCEGKDSYVATANVSPKEFLYKQKQGTETFLCGKLRNIIIADETELSSLYASFDASLKNKIGYLTKQFEKCIVHDAQDGLEKKAVEVAFHKQLQQIVGESNKQILKLQKEIHQQNENIELQNRKIRQQQLEIERLQLHE